MLRYPLIVFLILFVVGVPLLYKVEQDRTFRNFRCVVDGKLYRSGQMSSKGFQRIIKEYGVRTVISLRDSDQDGVAPPDQAEADYAREHGIRFIRLSPAAWSAPDGSIPATKNVAELLKILDDPKLEKPVLMHCFAGIHRTGAYTAIYRMEYQGWTNNECIEEMNDVAGRRNQFRADVLGFLGNYQPCSNRCGKN